MATAKDYVIATRPWSFSMSIISVTMGTILAAKHGPILWGWYALVVIGVVCFHAGANVINDYYDTKYRVDQPDSPTTKYRPQPILAGLLTPEQLLFEAVVLFAFTISIGLFLAFTRSLLVLWIGLIGFFTSVYYTAGPVKFKYRAIGEVAVFLMWGPLMCEGAYAVQRQTLSWQVLLISLPIGIWVALVLLANNMRDIEYDTRTKIKTLSIILGPRGSYFLYAGLIMLSYVLVLVLILTGFLGPWALLVFFSVPKAVGLLRSFKTAIPDAADAVTAKTENLFGLLLIAALILNRIVPP